MNQNFSDEGPQFDNLDADAVCQQCGTVNPEDTLLCKVCGNNLRDQRALRIAGENIPVIGGGVSGVRIFTGILATLGIIAILLAAYSVQNIESWLTGVQNAGRVSAAGVELWSGRDGELLDQLRAELKERPSSRRQRELAIEEPINDDSYNGRYVLASPTPSGGISVIGEANLSRRGNKIYFAALPILGDTDIRGFGILRSEDNRLVANRTVGIRSDGGEYVGFGFSQKLPEGGHACLAQSSLDTTQLQILAYRIR